MAKKVGGVKKIILAPNKHKIGDLVTYKGIRYPVSFAENGFVTLENVGTYLFVIVGEDELD